MRTAFSLHVALVTGLVGLASPHASFTPAGAARSPSLAPPAACTVATAADVDRCVRINQLQVIGTHNSYHIAPEPAVLRALGDRGPGLDYTHRPLTEQLDHLGIRQFEIDVFADPRGGHYVRRETALPPGLARSPVPASVMAQPGFKVFHVQDIDVRTTCPTLVACLTEIRDWSRANPSHVPVMVMIELKDQPLDKARGLDAVTPVPIGAAELDALDAEIRTVFPPAQLITPDSVRGRHATLRAALEADGWPTLGAARGKVLFALDNTSVHRERYLEGHPSLQGRVLFVSADPASPAGAFLKMNEAIGDSQAAIARQVAAGYLVRTRADEPAREARTGSTVRRDAALASGAQYVSTDYPEVSPYGTGYVARLPGAPGLVARCNPVTAPPGCRDEWLEP